ncbi:hypothetical protein GCM10011608_16240 [Micromonospora sonchi]|uniref:DNA helicase n=1 Tax=Micromonospora sonchi TaxID=1763543 RepID=A0A917WU34_9ACTN|nr:hypothetical protein GCM10011608_16240 [Micromonospora sonchi]
MVDEAQDLSPMQCRVIARRSEHGSLTLLGDLAQATATADDLRPAARVTVMPATLVKGLEYDHVIVIEPAAIVGA